VLSVGESVTAVAGKHISITDLGALAGQTTGYRGENTTHNFLIPANDPRVKILGSGANTKIVIDPDVLFDLDLSSSYTLSVEAGAFLGTSTGLASSALAPVSFSTVTPYAVAKTDATFNLANAQQAFRIENDGTLIGANRWVDIEGRGLGLGSTQTTGYSSAVTLDANTLVGGTPGNFTFVFKDVLDSGGAIGFAGISVATDFNVRIQNFGSGDRIYVDDAFNDPAKINQVAEEVFYSGDGSASATGALYWGLTVGSGVSGDPKLYVELAGNITAQNASLAAVNQILSLIGINESIIQGG